MKKNTRNEVDDMAEELIDDICCKAELERLGCSISDDSDLFMLMDTLKTLNEYADKAYKCKTVKAINKLRKRMKFVLE